MTRRCPGRKRHARQRGSKCMAPEAGKDVACVRNRGRPALLRQSQQGEDGLRVRSERQWPGEGGVVTSKRTGQSSGMRPGVWEAEGTGCVKRPGVRGQCGESPIVHSGLWWPHKESCFLGFEDRKGCR